MIKVSASGMLGRLASMCLIALGSVLRKPNYLRTSLMCLGIILMASFGVDVEKQVDDHGLILIIACRNHRDWSVCQFCD